MVDGRKGDIDNYLSMLIKCWSNSKSDATFTSNFTSIYYRADNNFNPDTVGI